MNKKVYKILNIIPFVIFFVTIFYFSRGVGLKGDDLSYILRSSYNFVLPEERITNIFQVIESAFYDYLIQDARFISSMVCTSVLSFDLKVYQILNPIILTFTFYLGLKTINQDKDFDSLKTLVVNSLALLLFYSMSPSLLEDAVFWITGATFYAWTLLSAIFVVRLMIRKQKENVFNYIFYLVVILRASFSTENLSLSLSIVLLVVTIYYQLFKKDKTYFKGLRRVMFILFWIFNFVEMMSPGSHQRAEQITISIYQRAIYGITYYFQSQFVAGGIIAPILISALIMVVRKYNKKVSNCLFVFVIPYLIIVSLYALPINNQFIYDNMFLSFFVDSYNMFNIIGGHYLVKFIIILYYACIALIVAGVSIFLFFKEKNELLLLFVIMSTISNMALIPLGGAAERTAYPAQIFMILTIALLIYQYKEVNTQSVIVVIFFILGFMMFFQKTAYLTANVKVNTLREKIFEQIKSGSYDSEEITLPKYRFTLLGNFDNYYSFGDKLLIYYLGVDDSYYLNMVDRSEFGIK